MTHLVDFARFVLRLMIMMFVFAPSNVWAYSPYSTRELEQLEKEFVEQINQSDAVIRNPLATQYINHLAKRLAYHGEIKPPYFFIVKSNEINAFAGPGGYIGVNSELILATENESELAAVMSHEMAHVRLHHLYRMLEHQKQMRIPMIAGMLASIALGVVNPALGSGAMMASMSGLAQDSINFVRSNEKEADRIGIDMLARSGLDPRGMASFFMKMQQNARYYYTSDIPAILRTHPLDEDRIAEAENRCQNLGNKHYSDNLDYRLFKEVVRNIVSSDINRLIDYYQRQCPKTTPAIACQYGYVLALMSNNQYQKAESELQPLLDREHVNLYFIVAMAQIAIGQKQYERAVLLLKAQLNDSPDNYAIIINYAQSLIAANKPKEAAAVLLQGTRRFKTDLMMCEQLARAEALNHRKEYAYFVEAQCQLLQGRKREALRQLKVAKDLNKNDRLLQARITAKIEEVKYLLE